MLGLNCYSICNWVGKWLQPNIFHCHYTLRNFENNFPTQNDNSIIENITNVSFHVNLKIVLKTKGEQYCPPLVSVWLKNSLLAKLVRRSKYPFKDGFRITNYTLILG